MKKVSNDRPVPLAAADFESSVMEADRPVLVAFTAEWCAPCMWLTPYLDTFAAESEGALLVFMVDTDEAPEITEGLGIASVPTVLFFRLGEVVARSVGVEPDRLHQIVESLTDGDTPA